MDPARRITQDFASWLAGYIASVSGHPPTRPPAVVDTLAYASGFIEGRAAKQRADD